MSFERRISTGTCAPACEEVLETMFFTSVMDSPRRNRRSCGQPQIGSRLVFAGAPSGAFRGPHNPKAAARLARGGLPGRDGVGP